MPILYLRAQGRGGQRHGGGLPMRPGVDEHHGAAAGFGVLPEDVLQLVAEEPDQLDGPVLQHAPGELHPFRLCGCFSSARGTVVDHCGLGP